MGTIVFTDIVGFTAWTNLRGDEAAAALLDRQEALVRSLLGEGDRLVKEIGDGLLLWFEEAPAAVTASLHLQRTHEGRDDEELPLWLRIGAHVGEPTWRGNDIVGRDVNLASRIADLAGPGEVLCSLGVADACDLAEVSFVGLGPVFVKGFADPIQVVRAELASADAAPGGIAADGT